MNQYDLIVLGAGNAGLAAARVAREADWKVLVVEARDAGGTCPIRGCVPKKVLVAATESLELISRAAEHGIEVDKPRLNWKKLIAREQSFVEGVGDEVEKSLKARGIDLVKGRGRFVDRHIVEVGIERYEARKILVATGSTPRPLSFPGSESLISSEDILSSPELPESIVFIGGGVVAMELGHVLARAGSKVTLLEVGERPLGGLDPDAVGRLVEHTRDLGVKIYTGVKVGKIASDEKGLTIHFEHEGEKREIGATAIANGAGRVANLAGLHLDCAEVEVDGHRVLLDEKNRSKSNPSIYFAGDALVGKPQLSPLATREGRAAGRRIVGLGAEEVNYDANPSVVFTLPALAQVGLSEAEATRRGLAYEVIENDMSGWRSARTYLEQTAYAKVLVEKESGRILGAHLLGHGSQETIHAFAFAIEHGLGREDLASAAYAYPTFHSDLKYLV